MSTARIFGQDWLKIKGGREPSDLWAAWVHSLLQTLIQSICRSSAKDIAAKAAERICCWRIEQPLSWNTALLILQQHFLEPIKGDTAGDYNELEAAHVSSDKPTPHAQPAQRVHLVSNQISTRPCCFLVTSKSEVVLSLASSIGHGAGVMEPTPPPQNVQKANFATIER